MSESSEILRLEDVHVRFPGRSGLRPRPVYAVRGVSLHLAPGETLGLVGESGSGKSTAARAALRLVPVSSGTVLLDGEDLTGLGGAELRRRRRKAQMVFQDPFSSLDPSSTVGDSIAEPLRTHLGLGRAEREARVAELLELVGLDEAHAARYPQEFSGGQRQRIAIARAIAVSPAVVVCDEAVSSLDVSTQNQVLNLLGRLQRELGTAYLFIAHDLAVVRHIADRVAVMYLGEIVEEGPTRRVYGMPAHPYTEALLSAIPVPDPDRAGLGKRIVLPGDMPDATAPPPGCAFHTRCPYAMEICSREAPPVVEVEGGGRSACHLHTSGPSLGGAPLAGDDLSSWRAERPAAERTAV
ncbi:MAG: ATP-binding cassette domain-containing protein [Streptosporangiales bacterium]|nr:ATP-binding cassette domain-containing protein [Streptosporangiales bacterium]